jgi:hypothetical protein
MLVRACVYRNDPEAVNRGPPLHYLILQRRGQPQSHGTMEGEAAAYGSVPAVRRRRRWCSRNSGARTAARQHPPVPAGAQRERGCDLLVSIQKFHHTHSPSLIHHPTIICTTLLSHSNDYLKCSLLFFAAVSASPYNSAALSSLPPFNSARLSPILATIIASPAGLAPPPSLSIPPSATTKEHELASQLLFTTIHFPTVLLLSSRCVSELAVWYLAVWSILRASSRRT